MRLRLRDGLIFVDVTLARNGQSVTLNDVLLDTGSATTLFNIDAVLPLGLRPEPGDTLRRIRGVGGSEFVFEKTVALIGVGALQQRNFAIQVGDMDYGLRCDGILGLDFLLRTRAVIDLAGYRLQKAE